MKDVTAADIAKGLAEALGKDEAAAQGILGSLAEVVREAVAQGKGVELGEQGSLVIKDEEAAVLPAGELAAALAAKAALPEEEARKTLDNLNEVFQNHLPPGSRVIVDGIGEFEARREKAKIGKDPKRGCKMISPPKKVFAFQPAEALRQAAGDKKLGFTLGERLRKALEVSKVSTILLAVPEDDFFTRTLVFHFSRAGWNVQVSTSVVDAVQKLDPEGTHLVILDTTLKNHQRLCEAVKCQRETSLIPLICLYPKGTNVDHPTEFMICGDEPVTQPFEVKKLLSIADSELVRSSEEEAIFEQQVSFQFPTEDLSLDKANEMGHRLFEKSGLREEDQVALSAALREAMGNAAQHGNKYRRDRKIEVLYLLDREKITVMVKDQGQGFDHERYVKRGQAGDALNAARERHREGKLGGLGIMLMLKCVDNLEYNDVGNALTLTKLLHKKESADDKQSA